MPSTDSLEPASRTAATPVLVVGDWAATVTLPSDAEGRLRPAPAAVALLAAVIALATAATTPTWADGVVGGWALLVGALLSLATSLLLALGLRSRSADDVVVAVSTVGWALLVSALLGSATMVGAPRLVVLGLVAVGVAGQTVVVVRSQVAGRRDVGTVRRLRSTGQRSDGWVVERTGNALQGALVVEAADGSGRHWTVEHRGMRQVWPAVGHPVGIWADDAGAVVLLPRRVP